MRTRSTPDVSRDVAIFSANPETLDGLETYLRGVGLRTKGRRTLEGGSDLTSASTLAIVFFPDDFPWETVIATLAEVAARCPRTLRVLVTAQPQQYERLLNGGANVMVVPRPVWGWTIIDAIRSHAEQHTRPASGAGERR